jgi:GNAT superfamily N-acetyltransferase
MVEFKYEKFNTVNYDKVREDLERNAEESGSLSWNVDPDVWVLVGSETCYIQDGEEIVGYCLFRILNHHHYNRVVGVSELIYVRPEYRGHTSIKFLRFVEETVKKLGAEGFLQSSSSAKDISKLMNRMGYIPTETVYFKEL